MNPITLRDKALKAIKFVEEYQIKQVRLHAMMETKKTSSDVSEVYLLLTWITSITKWLVDNEKEYERAQALSKVPTNDLKLIEEMDKLIYGDAK